MKLFRRTFITLYIVFIVLILIIFTIFSLNQINEIEKSKIKQYDILADVTSKELMLGYMDSMWPFASLNDLIRREGCLFWWVVKSDGYIYLADKASVMGTKTSDHLPQLRIQGEENTLFTDRDVGIITKNLKIGDKNWLFYLGFSLSDISLMRKKIILFNAIFFISALLVLAPAMMITMKHFAKPINKLVAATSMIGKGDLSYRVNITSDDELGHLSRAFNDMADRIRESDEKLTGIINSIADLMILVDQEYNITWTNKIAEDILGPDLVGNKCHRAYYQREEPCEPCIGREVFQDGQLHEKESTIILSDGSVRHFWCTANVARHYADGRPQTVIGIYRDITERKRAEDKLKNHLHFTETLLETIPSPIFYKDVSGRYLGCNRAFEEFWGKSRGEVIGKDVYDMGPKEIADKYAEMDQELFERPGTQMYEWKVRDADGSEKEVIFHKASFLDASGKVSGLIGVILDITEPKQSEKEIMRQREELRGLAARLSEVEESERKHLAQEIHDDVCQNLTSIAITLETLNLRAKQEPLDQLLFRLSDASNLIEQTGDIARNIMEGLRPTLLDHYGLMGGLRYLGEQFIKKTGIDLEILGEEAGPCFNPKLELALFRIAQEALNNVVKHAKASHVVVALEEGQGTMRLIISDNGSGFDQNLVTKPKGGRGWGLMTMTERAVALGGQCRIESQPGQGTRVAVKVPR